ncbi:uncharacterized protein LOC110708661 isoform X2 [Chenopodium quinoa]|nr:uncharacterized protein LOC110708661 isoform X2 [Chenopodium quinoa]
MNNDFDLERNTDEGVSDSHLNTEIRVSPGIDLGARISEIDEKGVLERSEWEMDEVRVLGGDTEMDTDTNTNTGYRLNGDSGNLVGYDGEEGDGEIEVKGQGMVSRDGEDEGGGITLSLNGIGNVGVHGMKREDVRGEEDSERDSKDDEFKLENRGDLQTSVSKDVSVSDGDDEIRSGLVLDSGFEMGDMVWGKVKSHPWWPGHLFNEAFATSSVRRTRRQGHLLVAFFGDSSYGWFDTTELVPYDPHFAEKSQQTASRNFVRAVEESIDEASRRSALGLSCYCRNPNNFRPANVPGYVAVDVVDYEPGAIYSLSQIRKARDSFQPFDALSFIKQLAVAPMSGESKSLDFIKNKATTLAYRRSIFEEFDETYAQAFSQSPVRNSQLPALDKVPSRAPLSGPLVMADTVGSRKSSTKALKTKELSKKDRYLFKRRDEAGNLRKVKTTQGHASSSSSSAYEDGASDSAAAFVLQKRDLPVSDDALALAGTTKDASTAGIGVMVPSASQELESSGVVVTDSGSLHVKVSDSHISSPTSIDVGQLAVRDGMIKKKKTAKRPAGEMSSEKSDRPEKKMKKVRKIDGQRSVGKVKKDLVLSAGMPTEIAALSREDSQVSQRRKDNEAINSVPSQVGFASSEEARGNEGDLAQLLADLRGLALNPVHGMERNGPAIAQQFFLKFRSSVFLKSSSASAAAESELREGRDIKSTPASESTEKPSVENSKAASSVKLQKLSARHEDPRKGWKRMPSERQEEKASKKAKKITEAKSSISEKRALLKNPEMLQRAEGKAKAAATQSPQVKSIKSEQRQKKLDRPKVVEPHYLIMKYPSSSSLPSLVELKARFARFGPMDTSLSRVFYKTNTCRVAFLYEEHARIAQRYATGSKSVFANVTLIVKPVAAAEPQQPSSGRAEDLQNESAANRDSSTIESKPVITAATPQQPVQQLKSCLKKPSGGDETGVPNNGGSSARTARVRFNMEEVKGSTDNRGGLEGQKMESRNSMLSSYEGSSSSSIAMDVSNNQRFTVSSHPLQPPLLPHPPHFIRPPINHLHDTVELSPRNNLHDNPRVVPLQTSVENQVPPQGPQPTRDISQQMMNLLTRCHDVVTNVKSMLGYVPYHPL